MSMRVRDWFRVGPNPLRMGGKHPDCTTCGQPIVGYPMAISYGGAHQYHPGCAPAENRMA